MQLSRQNGFMHVFGQACHAHRSGSLPTSQVLSMVRVTLIDPNRQKAEATLLGSGMVASCEMSSSVSSTEAMQHVARLVLPTPWQLVSCRESQSHPVGQLHIGSVGDEQLHGVQLAPLVVAPAANGQLQRRVTILQGTRNCSARHLEVLCPTHGHSV